MISLTKEEVEHIAALACLTLSKEEALAFAKQLSETISYVEMLNELPTKDITPTFQTTGLKNVFRKDIIKPCLSQKQALANAQRTHKCYFISKSIF